MISASRQTCCRPAPWFAPWLGCCLTLAAELPVPSASEFLGAFTSEVWAVADGLPQSGVRSVTCADDGHLWVTTSARLGRFNGVSFEPVPLPPGFDALRNPLAGAGVATDGALWLHGYRKVWRHDGREWESLADGLFATRTDENEDVVRILHHPDGSSWWLLRGGLVRWQHGQPLQEWLEPATPEVVDWYTDVAIDGEGDVWVAGDGRLARVEGGSLAGLPTAGMSDGRPFGLRISARTDGGIWVYAATGLFHVTDTGIVHAAPLDLAPRSERVIEAADRSVWVASDTGVQRWHDGRWSVLKPGELPSVSRFTTVASAADDTLWLGGDGGLAALRPRGHRFVRLPTGSRIGCRSPAAAWFDGGGELLVGAGDRIYQMEPGGRGARLLAMVPGASQPGASMISALARDEQGALWVGTGNEQLWCWRDAEWRHFTADANSPVPATGITCILPWPGQAPFIGSVNGMMRVTSRSTMYPAHPDLTLDRVQCLVRDPLRGGIWIGFESHGLEYFEPGPNRLGTAPAVSGLPAGRVNSVLPAADGSLWISVGGAIVRWAGGRVEFVFDRRHGLPDAELGLLADDGQGGLWLAGSGSLAHVPIEDFAAVQAGGRPALRVRHHGHGLPADTVFNPLAGEFPPSLSGVWFGVAGGLVEARSGFLPATPLRPVVRITRISGRGATLADLDPLFHALPPAGPLHVRPGSNPFDISFAAFSAGPPASHHYRIRIPAIDRGWTELGATRSFNIPYLPPGSHRIELAVRDAHGNWVEASPAATLMVEAWFWQTRWFLALAALAGGGAVFGTTRWLVRRRYHRRRHQEELIHHERSRIARDIHDDLGAGLTHIAMLARIAEGDAARNPGAQLGVQLREVFSEASSMVRSVDEIVWAVTPANDNLRALVDYIVHYAQHFLRTTGIACRIDLPDPLPAMSVRSAIRHHVYMVVHEALNNVVKHAGASEVRITAHLDGGRLHLVIHDDGCGFDPAVVRPDDEPGGLDNFAERMERIAGRFTLDSTPGAGARVTFEIPLNQSQSKKTLRSVR